MLSLAIKARIPIIRARTSDLLNLPAVLECIAPGMTVDDAKRGVTTKANLLYAVEEMEVTRQQYDQLVQQERVLLLINQGNEVPYAFDAGEVPVPKALMEDLLDGIVPQKKIAELLPAFNGLTLKQMAEIIKLVTTRDKALSVQGISTLRAQLTGKLQGLSQVDLELPLYLCPAPLQQWVNRNKRYFIHPIDQRLVPRGILLNGAPGVGKSEAAKFIANQFGVSLYRLDLSSSLSKWIGESEAGLSRILATLDSEEPCVLLIDEVEKLFAETEDQGVTSRMLSQLLWWQAEHKSRVLTVMTSNDINKLPKELYRARRVDTTLTINKLEHKEASTLAVAVLKQFIEKPSSAQLTALQRNLQSLTQSHTKAYAAVAHAEVVQMVYDLIKDQHWLTF